VTVYLTVDDVLRLHAVEVGPDVGLRDLGLLDAAVNRPAQSAFGEDAYPTLAAKAAALLERWLGTIRS
jgi:death on curing protein